MLYGIEYIFSILKILAWRIGYRPLYEYAAEKTRHSF